MIQVKIEKNETEFSFDIDTHFRTAILGENGIGKTSILESIAQKCSVQEWLSVHVPGHVKIVYFSQIEQKREPLSGGEHAKKRLVELLRSTADLYVLDEPTNNLDQENIEWLKQEIISKKLPVLFTSHDVDFIDSVAEVIYFLDSKGVEKTKERCSLYLETRKKKVEQAFTLYEATLKKQKDLLESARAAKQHAAEGAKWRGSDNDKFLRGFKRDKAAKSGGIGRRLEERAEEMEVARPQYDPLARVVLSSGARNGNLFSFSTTALNGKLVSMSLGSGDKVLVTGENGVGKTTLFDHLYKLLQGSEPDSKEQFRRSGNFSYLYLSQDWYEHLDEVTVSEYLAGFGLDDQEQYRSISYNYLDKHILTKKFKEVSPGVRVKVLLGVLSFKAYDLIMWDEPTNHLDVMVQKILQEAFVQYKGVLLIISHDKFLSHSIEFSRVRL